MNKSSLKKQDCSVVVIIPYYNGSKYIRRSVQSVLDQTVTPDEFVVVDDGSAPDEAATLDKIALEMGFEVLHKENGGQGSARNYGVAHTKSRFISFLDQDDFYHPNHIKKLLQAIEWDDPKFGWVYGDLYRADEDGNIINTKSIAGGHHPKTEIVQMISLDMLIFPSATLINRQAFEDVGGFDPQFKGYEDDDLFLRMFRKGWSNYFLPEPVTVWCLYNNSTTYSIEMSRSRLKYIIKLCEIFPDQPDLNLFFIRDYIVPRFMRTIISEARQAVRKPKTPQQIKMYEHREEIIANLDQFFDLVTHKTTLNTHVLRKLKKRISRIKIKRWFKKLINQY